MQAHTGLIRAREVPNCRNAEGRPRRTVATTCYAFISARPPPGARISGRQLAIHAHGVDY